MLQKLFYTVNNKRSVVGWSLLRKQFWKMSEGSDCPQHPKKVPDLQEHAPRLSWQGPRQQQKMKGRFRERLQGRDLQKDVCS